MPLTKDDLTYAAKQLQYRPLTAISLELGIDPIELTAALRKHGLLKEMQPVELGFIVQHLRTMSHAELQGRLSMTTSQFKQIVASYFGSSSEHAHLTLEQALDMTKRLLQKLALPLNDRLPRTLRVSPFTHHGLGASLELANREKKSDPYFRHFTAIAFLVCKAFPGLFEPFQFANAKTNEISLEKMAAVDAWLRFVGSWSRK